MKPGYVARRLLEHGPLTFSEMLEITGWQKKRLFETLCRLTRSGVARRQVQRGRHRFIYALQD